METRFRSNDAAGVEIPWQTIDDILDALEDGRLDADDYVFDRARQAWQPLRNHGEIVAAWDQRMSYRPPEHRRLITRARRPAEGFPALSAEGATPVSSPALSRIEAAGRQVEQDLPQAMLIEPGADLGRRHVIRKQKLDGLEPCRGRGPEALQERPLIEHHGKVRGETGHRGSRE